MKKLRIRNHLKLSFDENYFFSYPSFALLLLRRAWRILPQQLQQQMCIRDSGLLSVETSEDGTGYISHVQTSRDTLSYFQELEILMTV